MQAASLHVMVTEPEGCAIHFAGNCAGPPEAEEFAIAFGQFQEILQRGLDEDGDTVITSFSGVIEICFFDSMSSMIVRTKSRLALRDPPWAYGMHMSSGRLGLWMFPPGETGPARQAQ